jgi:hypothetical protein
MPEDFVEREIHLDNLDAVHIGDDWRIEPSAAVDYIETRRTPSSLFSRRRIRAVE